MVSQVQKVLIYVHCSLESTTYTIFLFTHIHNEQTNEWALVPARKHSRTHHWFPSKYTWTFSLANGVFHREFSISLHKHESLLENVRKILLTWSEQRRKEIRFRWTHQSLDGVCYSCKQQQCFTYLCNNQACKMF